ncbi:MAG: hypothetical protein BGO96_05945 [Micrococcales bacterium 73-15]|uniref:hypothetical protein n=1 Tax=Salana multivorans TaxID=120377 RepID=UPI000968CD24|nr:hypothetical protein [Salana multivorans]OJX97446.1 MAG: hypothetical protein BGO96_05945 [Micrococcales bacterium 73-15]
MTDREEQTSPAQDALEREVLERLRSADPARDIEPSAGFVASVLARMDDDDAGALASELPLAAAAHAGSASADPGVATAEMPEPGPIDLAAARAARESAQPARKRRWQPWLAGAAAAAVVGVVGFGAGSIAAGGGFGGGDSGGAYDASSARDSAPELASGQPESAYPGPITLGDSSGGADGASSAGGAPTAEMDAARGASGYGWGFGHREFVGSGFSTSAGAATLYGLDPQRASEETAAHLAETLGVTGAPRLDWGSWYVGPEDGEGPTLSVSLDGSAAFSYQNWSIEPMQECWSVAGPTSEDYDDDAWRAYEEEMQACTERVDAAAPAPDAARAELERLLTDVGLDPASFELTAEHAVGSGTAQASAARIVDGQRTDLAFSLSYGPAGVVSVWGSLADVVALRDVAIVSEADALARLSDPRFGAQNMVMPYAVDAYAADGGATEEYTPPTQAPAAPGADATVEWPVWTVDLTSVRLGLGQQYQSDGSVLLVPAYEFTDSDGGTWSVIAVADADLSFDQLG